MNLRQTTSLLVIAAGLSFPVTARAVYTPNPAGRWEAHRFTLAGDFQFNADKDLDANLPKPFNVNDMYGLFVRPGYSIAENVMIYGRLGFQGSDDVDTGFAGGFGIQGAFEIPNLRELAVGAAFDYVHWAGDFKHGSNIEWNEFQITPAVSYQPKRMPDLAAYAGLMFDFVDAHHLSEDDPVGLLFGASYDVDRHVRLEGQARVISENGFLLSCAYMF